eukprot:682772-Karenia_brevis.AAC.1
MPTKAAAQRSCSTESMCVFTYVYTCIRAGSACRGSCTEILSHSPALTCLQQVHTVLLSTAHNTMGRLISPALCASPQPHPSAAAIMHL